MNKNLLFTLTFLIMLGTVLPIPKINVAHADIQFLLKLQAESEAELQRIDDRLGRFDENNISADDQRLIDALIQREEIVRRNLANQKNEIKRAQELIAQEQRREEQAQQEQKHEEAVKECDENDPTSGVCFNNPITGRQEGLTPLILWGRLIRFILSIVGSVALLFFVIGGFKYMTAHGNEELIKEGKATLVWATLGLAVVFGSYLLLSNIITVLLQAFGIA